MSSGWVAFLGVVGLVAVVAVLLERLANRGVRGAGTHASDGVGAGMLGGIADVFQPSHTHLTQERQRERMAIVQRPSEAPPFDVDLDAGVVRITPPAPAPDEVRES